MSTPCSSRSAHAVQARWPRSTVALAALLLAACGGGTVEPEVPTTPVTPTTPVSTSVAVDVETRITDTSGADLAGATVTLVTRALEAPVVATVASDGHYSLQTTVEAAQLPTDAPVLVTISKVGYATQVLELTPAELTQGSVRTTEPVVLDALVSTELAPAAGVNLTRVGDNKAPADELNKYMQTRAVGRSTTIELGRIDSLVDTQGELSAYPTMTLSISFRALQASDCPDDEVRLYQAATADASPVEIQRFRTTGTPIKLPDSSLNGSLTLFQPTFSTAAMKLGQGPLWLEVKSGLCMVDEYDDFEFVNVHARFNAPV